MKKRVTTITFPDLERQLQELASTDFEKFKKLTSVDMVQVYVCVEKEKGKSLQQIANKLKISKQSVSQRCKKCQQPEDLPAMS